MPFVNLNAYFKQPQKTLVNYMELELIQDLKLLFLVLGVFLAWTLGIFLVLNKSAKNKANRYLGILVLCISSFFMPRFLNRFGILEYFPHVIGLARIIPFLFGPLTYLYVRACTQQGFEMRRTLWLHFIPAFLMLLHCMPQLMISGAEKLMNHANFTRTGVVDYPWVWLLKVIHPMIYFALAVKLILNYRQYVSNTSSSIDNAFHRWLLVFIFILTLPIIGLLGFVFTKFGTFSIIMLSVGLVAFLVSIYIATLVKPQIFHAFPHQMPIPESTEEQKQKYENSRLQANQKDQYLEKLKTFMESEKFYQSPELTLAQLSEKVKIPSHYLSQVINEKLNCNFLDFVNSYRVEDAKEKLVDPKFAHYTILSVAYEAGFNSKSTFYAAFKKGTGMTPSKYRKNTIAA